MKIYTTALGLLLLGWFSTNSANHFQQPPAGKTKQPPTQTNASSGQAKVDPAKEADIRRLLELTGAKALAVQTMTSMEDGIKPLMSNSLPPGDYRDQLIDLFFAKFHSKADAQHLVDIAVPIYDKYLTNEEVKGLIKFYETPLGQKATGVMPKMVGEIQGESREWGEKLGREAMMEVLTEHPELEKALEAAQKVAQQQ
jgi:uncharacterized protein